MVPMIPGAAVRCNHRHAARGGPADRSWGRRVLPKVPEVRRILPLKIDSGRRKDRSERDREVEARCGELLRLLGQGRDRLLGLHGGVSLQPAESRDPSPGALDDPALVPGAVRAPPRRQFRLRQTLAVATGAGVDRLFSVGQTLIYLIPRYQRLRSRLIVLEGLNWFALKKWISLESFQSTKVFIF
jgi:hypothetical protein